MVARSTTDRVHPRECRTRRRARRHRGARRVRAGRVGSGRRRGVDGGRSMREAGLGLRGGRACLVWASRSAVPVRSTRSCSRPATRGILGDRGRRPSGRCIISRRERFTCESRSDAPRRFRPAGPRHTARQHRSIADLRRRAWGLDLFEPWWRHIFLGGRLVKLTDEVMLAPSCRNYRPRMTSVSEG